MSLPDTVFIFVLALIIFGPKKLPEIGRQIGKLVGEFRRASNEFKFQIEEELRQADIIEKPSTRPSIAAPLNAPAAETSNSPALSDAVADPAADLPVGQYPNIDSLNTAELDPARANLSGFDGSGPEPTSAEPASAPADVPAPAAVPTISPAEGSQARTAVPFAAADASAENSSENPDISVRVASENVASPPQPDAPVEAEITHG